ncbi:hypothetical protein BY458DRAFT_441815 [Sporodiniella umbellata]|nr:hypothetical protein BY458DRAFT_441815 [Sporodiniella umbellata]
MSPGPQSIADLVTEVKPTTGDIPPPSIGATTVVIGSSLYLFGGRLASSRQLINHLYILNLNNNSWTRHIPEPRSAEAPQPRYFHSADVYDKYLIIFGGMGQTNKMHALSDLCVFDTERMVWKHIEKQTSLYSPKERYAHISVVSGDKLIIIGGQDIYNQYINEKNTLCLKTFTWVSAENSLKGNYGAYRSVATSIRKADKSLWGSHMDTVCVYSNYNFSNVTRDLESFPSLSPTSEFKNHSSNMSGGSLPPGLRFPSGHILGQYMIITGVYLTSTVHTFQVWALNLVNLTWTRIDVGSTLTYSSWSKTCLDYSKQKLIVFGNKSRKLLDDYSHRRANFDHIAIVDLETFGIYRLPPETSPRAVQELGLNLLNDSTFADLENDKTGFKRLLFPENYSVTLAFFQFLYTDHIITAQQHHPQTLLRLLILSELYKIPRLRQLTVHALHQCLTISTSSMIYEVSALTGCSSLQIRALRIMLNAKRIIQRKLKPIVPGLPSPTFIIYPSALPSSPTRASMESESSPTVTRFPSVSKSLPGSTYSRKSSYKLSQYTLPLMGRSRKTSLPPLSR